MHRRKSDRDVAKASAAPDKNVRDVFEQHLCWPEGRAPFMGRVIASLVAWLRARTLKVSRSDAISRGKAWGHGAAAIELPRVGRVQQCEK
ncbi:hypothetical protein [Pectobacterium carotovorum]|uniref:hypothetical protein n=1 Tax=Pectobacterium carotovorum TaxID=554 RepID=UPI0037FCE958